MKNNQPLLNEEIILDEDTVIVSKTDLKGIITYVNDEFIRISGYSEAELIGRNHNIVRHPDVPAAAFRDLWDTIKAGKPWSGLVKNRAKSGAFYWVQANVTPVYNNGRVDEYMSVRLHVSEQQKRAATELYDAINRGVLPKPPLRVRLGFLGRLKLTRKIVLTATASLLLAATLLGLLISNHMQRIVRAEAEIAGLEYIQPLRQLLQNLPKHRGMSNAYLSGDRDFKPRILEKQGEIEKIIASIPSLERERGDFLHTQSRSTSVIGEWAKLKQDLFGLEPKVAFARHTALINDLINLIKHVGDNSALIVDGNQSRHYLVDLLINRIPAVCEYLGQIRGMGAGIAARGEFASGQRDRLTDLFSSARVLFNEMDQAVKLLYRHDARLKLLLEKSVAKSNDSRMVFFEAVRSGMLDAERVTQDPAEFFAKGSRLIDTNFEIFDQVNAILRSELEDAADWERAAMYRTLAGSLLAMLLVGGIAFTIMRNIRGGSPTYRIISGISPRVTITKRSSWAVPMNWAICYVP